MLRGPELGARILDRVYPEWYEFIDTKRLDMVNVHNCVLGQLFRQPQRPHDCRWVPNSGYNYVLQNAPGGAHQVCALIERSGLDGSWSAEEWLPLIKERRANPGRYR